MRRAKQGGRFNAGHLLAISAVFAAFLCPATALGHTTPAPNLSSQQIAAANEQHGLPLSEHVPTWANAPGQHPYFAPRPSFAGTSAGVNTELDNAHDLLGTANPAGAATPASTAGNATIATPDVFTTTLHDPIVEELEAVGLADEQETPAAGVLPEEPAREDPDDALAEAESEDLGRRGVHETPVRSMGGHVEHEPHVRIVFWGSNWNSEPGKALRQQLLTWYESLSGSAEQGILTQYFDAQGHITQHVTVTSTTDERVIAATNVTEAAVENEVTWSEGTFGPTNTETQTDVILAPGTTYNTAFATGYCAFHDVTSAHHAAYAFIPYSGDEPWNEGNFCPWYGGPHRNPGDATNVMASHEYAETVTDPFWATEPAVRTFEGSQAEIADLCATVGDELPNHTWVQGYYDAYQNRCSESDPEPPEIFAASEAATNLTYNGTPPTASAKLNGTVNPEGYAATYYFEYGPTTTYGSRAPTTENLSAGSSKNNTSVSETISSLELNHSYHYRLVATSSAGTTYGEDRTVTPSTWHVNTPARPANWTGNWLNGVSCSSAHFCAAVGYEPEHVLSYVDNEGAWEQKTVTTPGTEKWPEFNAVSCVRGNACAAVGEATVSEHDAPILQYFSHGSWAEQTLPQVHATEAHLAAVSCYAANECLAVGGTGREENREEHPYALLWANGHTTELPYPQIPNTIVSQFSGISCTSATFCMAVGTDWAKPESNIRPWSATWNGTNWTLRTTTRPEGNGENEEGTTFAVSCTTPTFCMDTGRFHYEPITEQWNGTTWTRVTVPTLVDANGGALRDISCTSPTSCAAVGYGFSEAAESNEPAVTLEETWNGTTWTEEKTSRPSETVYNELAAVSCLQGTHCVTSGWELQHGHDQTLLETHDWAELTEELAPTNETAPSLTTVHPDEGAAAAVNVGLWEAYPAASYTYQWQHCNPSGAECTNIAGATASEYSPVSADLGDTLDAIVTATNALGQSSATTSATQPVVIAAPSPTAGVPQVSGYPFPGYTLTTTNGTWQGTPPTAYAYQWNDCNTAGTACTPIAGATAASYAVTSGDVGGTITDVVTATNSAGTAQETSAATRNVVLHPAYANYVAADHPVDWWRFTQTGKWLNTGSDSYVLGGGLDWSGEPAIPGDAATESFEAGRSIRVTTTSQYPSPRGEGTLTPISGTFTVEGWVKLKELPTSGHEYELVNTRSNPGSDTTFDVAIANAYNTGESTVTGVHSDIGTGTQWLTQNANASYAFAASTWYEIDETVTPTTYTIDVNGTEIGSGTLSGGTPVLDGPENTPTIGAYGTYPSYSSAFVGNLTNFAFYNTALTPTQILAHYNAGDTPPESAPTNTSVPTISGTKKSGETLTATPGTWTAQPVPTYAYQWQRCNTAGEECANIATATNQTYTLTSNDAGKRIRVMVTASNSDGEATATSTATVTITSAPVNTSLPTISGTATVGDTLEATTGTWTGTEPITYAYQWQRCNASGASCVNINSATTPTYTLTVSDIGHELRVAVTATNSAGETSTTSATTTTVPGSPENTTLPTISGEAKTASQLAATTGIWTSTELAYSYQWQRCNASGTSCLSIGGASEATYTVVPADAAHTLRIVVTAKNTVGETSATSAASALLTGPPVVTPDSATSVTQTGAEISAAINPNGGSTEYQIEYGTTTAYGTVVGRGSTNATTATTDSAEIIGLLPNTTYYYRAVATNAAGTTLGTDGTFTTVTPPPANTAAPTISGTATVGDTLEATTGTWTGTEPITYAYQWQRCNTSGASCVNINSATTPTYTLTVSDIGHELRVAVTAKNTASTVSATSSATTTITPSAGAPAVEVGTITTVTTTSATLNFTVNPNGAELSSCTVQYGPTTAYESSAPCTAELPSGTSVLIITKTLTSLVPATIYHYRVVVTNPVGTTTTSGATFTTHTTPLTPPTVETKPATAIAQNAAQLNANVNPNGTEVNNCVFEYGTTTAYGSTVACSPDPGDGTSNVAVSASVSGLAANTLYHYRVVATNSVATTTTSDATFTTSAVTPPTVETNAATAVTHNTATLNAHVNPNGNAVSACELEYGTTTAYGSTIACSSTPGSATTSVAVSATLGDLGPGMTYHYRVVATNAGGTTYGADATLHTTPLTAATVETRPATAIAQNSAQLNANVNPNGTEVSSCIFEYGTTIAYESTVTCSAGPVAGTNNVMVSASVSGLAANTLYHYRVVVASAAGSVAGQDKPFTTPATEAAAASEPTVSPQQTTAVVNAVVNPHGAEITGCVFEYGRSRSHGSTTLCAQTPSPSAAATTVTAQLGDLTPNTHYYYYRLAVTTASGTVYSPEGSFVTLPLEPTVSVEETTAVTKTTATVHANVNPQGSSEARCHIEYGTTTSYGKTVECEGSLNSSTTPVAQIRQLSSLKPNTTYHYRVVVASPGGTTYSADATFLTAPPQPTAATTAAGELTRSAATLYANVDPDGGQTTLCVFEIGTTTAYGTTLPCSSSPGEATSAERVSALADGLKPNTTYHYRAVITSSEETAVGNDTTLTTLATHPAVLSRPANAVTQTTANIVGELEPNGGELSGCVFEYGTTTAYGTSMPCSLPGGSGNGVIDVNAQLTGLVANTTYYYRVSATGEADSVHSNAATFHTEAVSETQNPREQETTVEETTNEQPTEKPHETKEGGTKPTEPTETPVLKPILTLVSATANTSTHTIAVVTTTRCSGSCDLKATATVTLPGTRQVLHFTPTAAPAAWATSLTLKAPHAVLVTLRRYALRHLRQKLHIRLTIALTSGNSTLRDLGELIPLTHAANW